MATTANGLPYPVGTDRVADGDDAIRALAEALDPAWVVLGLNATFSARPGSLVPAYRVIAGVVYLRGQIQKTTNLATGDAPLTFPIPARPTALVGLAFAASKGTAGSPNGRLEIATTGVGTINIDGANVGVWFSLDGVSYSR